MFRDAAKYVKNCGTCMSYKTSQRGLPGKMHATPAEHPWQVVAVDLVGPLPRFSAGNTWLLAAQDKFTKWIPNYGVAGMVAYTASLFRIAGHTRCGLLQIVARRTVAAVGARPGPSSFA